MLNGDKNIKKEKQYEPKETTYEWEYGTVKKYQTKAFGDKYSPKEPSYQFRTAESFLNSLNKTKAEGVDLSQFRAGVTVYHKKFGEGIIQNIEAEGDDFKLEIMFDKYGFKRLMANYTPLEVLEI